MPRAAGETLVQNAARRRAGPGVLPVLIPASFVAVMGLMYLFVPQRRPGGRHGRFTIVFAGVLVSAILAYIAFTAGGIWLPVLLVQSGAVLIKALLNLRAPDEGEE